MDGYTFKKLGLKYLNETHKLESESYPSDEAASREKLEVRMKTAPDYFCGFVDENDKVIGFVCGTKIKNESYSERSLSVHEKEGKNLCIHSVVVAKSLRRKGIATKMLDIYVLEMKKKFEKDEVDKISLICKKNLIPLYKKTGFKLLGKSDVVHGKDPWYDMVQRF